MFGCFCSIPFHYELLILKRFSADRSVVGVVKLRASRLEYNTSKPAVCVCVWCVMSVCCSAGAIYGEPEVWLVVCFFFTIVFNVIL